MKLRRRLALLVTATVVPLVAAAVVGMNELWDHFAVRALREVALYRMESGGREECERSPATFALPRQEPAGDRSDADDASVAAPDLRHHAPRVLVPAAQQAEVFAYAATFVSANSASHSRLAPSSNPGRTATSSAITSSTP